MSFFKNLFSKSEPFVPTPTQTVPGLEPIVVQAVENLYPNTEDQKQAFTYLLKQSKDCDTLLLLALLSYSKTAKRFEEPAPIHDYHFLVDFSFRNMKAAEKWVKSITKPQA
jgi:hypothetical protein